MTSTVESLINELAGEKRRNEYTRSFWRDHEVIIYELASKGDEAVGPLSEAVKKDPREQVRSGAAEALRRMNPEKLSTDSRNAIVEAFLVGCHDDDHSARRQSTFGLRNEKLLNSANATLRENAVGGMALEYERTHGKGLASRLTIETLAKLDYSDMPKEAKRKALSVLVPASWNAGRWSRDKAAEGVERIGDSNDKKMVGEHWLPFLDNKEAGRYIQQKIDAVWILERVTYGPAADKAAELLPSSGYRKGELENIMPGLLSIIARSGDSRHEEALIPLIKADYKFGDKKVIFEGLRRFGGKKSQEKLKELLEEYEHGRDKDLPWREKIIESAKKTLAEIEKRMTVSSEPAKRKLEDAMRRRKVPA